MARCVWEGVPGKNSDLDRFPEPALRLAWGRQSRVRTTGISPGVVQALFFRAVREPEICPW